MMDENTVRTWNPDWQRELWERLPFSEEEDVLLYDKYIQTIKRLVLASIDWVESHSDLEINDLLWEERNIDNMLSEDQAADQIYVVAVWSDMLRPFGKHAEEWFDHIISASENGKINQPSYQMMKTGLLCGLLVKEKGWNVFDMFMHGKDDTMAIN